MSWQRPRRGVPPGNRPLLHLQWRRLHRTALRPCLLETLCQVAVASTMAERRERERNTSCEVELRREEEDLGHGQEDALVSTQQPRYTKTAGRRSLPSHISFQHSGTKLGRRQKDAVPTYSSCSTRFSI